MLGFCTDRTTVKDHPGCLRLTIRCQNQAAKTGLILGSKITFTLDLNFPGIKCLTKREKKVFIVLFSV